jgi:hypothetical protein
MSQWRRLSTSLGEIDSMAQSTYGLARKVKDKLNLRDDYSKNGTLKQSPSLDIKLWEDVVEELDRILRIQIYKMQKILNDLKAL